jgi:hypothetical protein
MAVATVNLDIKGSPWGIRAVRLAPEPADPSVWTPFHGGLPLETGNAIGE